jgi:hypothetical protein
MPLRLEARDGMKSIVTKSTFTKINGLTLDCLR